MPSLRSLTVFIATLSAFTLLPGCWVKASLDTKDQQQDKAEAIKNLPETKPLDSATKASDDIEELLGQCEAVMKGLVAGQGASSFTPMRSISLLADSEIEKLAQQTHSQLSLISPRFGRMVGIERVKILQKSPSVTEAVYLMKCEKHALRWRFVLYKPADKWFLNALYWDDKLQEL